MRVVSRGVLSFKINSFVSETKLNSLELILQHLLWANGCYICDAPVRCAIVWLLIEEQGYPALEPCSSLN